MLDFKYRPDVDGLRAVAVTLVLLFHAGLGFSGGFIGVDVFFVISGFLITGLILKEQDAGKFSLANFWARRIRRIVPAATFMIIVVLIVGYFVLMPTDYADLGESIIAQQLMYSNFHFCKNTGYFDGPSDLKPLLHTWSLAVEEQFYLGYPLLLMLLYRFGRRASLIVLGMIAISSLIASEYGVHRYPSGTFFLLPTRAWELLMGGLICFLPKPSIFKPKLLAALSWLSLSAILAAGWCYSSATPFPGLSALIPCVATALLIYSNSLHMSFPATLLATKPIVFIGLMSYSLYLVHWPIFAYGRYHYGNALPLSFSMAALVASLVAGFLSWRFVETPLRRPKSLFTKRSTIYAASIGSMVMIVFLGTVAVKTEGMIARFPASRFPWLHNNNPQAEFELAIEVMRQRGPMRLGTNHHDNDAIDWLVWGDSHGMALAPAFAHLSDAKGRRCEIAAKSGTPPVLDVWQQRHGKPGSKQWTDAITAYCETQEIRKVALIARWSYYLGDFPRRTVIAEDSCSENPEDAKRALISGLRTTIEWFRSRDTQVFLFVEVPPQHGSPKNRYTQAVLNEHFPVLGATVAEFHDHQAAVSEVLDSLNQDGVTIVSLESCFFAADEPSKLGDRVGPFYEDGDHLTPYGAETLVYPLLCSLDAKNPAAKLTVNRPAPPYPAPDSGLTPAPHQALKKMLFH